MSDPQLDMISILLKNGPLDGQTRSIRPCEKLIEYHNGERCEYPRSWERLEFHRSGVLWGAPVFIYAGNPDIQNTTPWQPIESAPKDGRRILIADFTIGRRFQIVAFWHSTDGRWCTDCIKLSDFLNYSHWMPLAEPPVEEEKESK